ncbi:hypothetical protein RAS1_13140 [Phycisphaerae bacterium RAS1]|nr:hypothetical protein RAS1_13140 [Phycisphaerae bacterium RAS1]
MAPPLVDDGGRRAVLLSLRDLLCWGGKVSRMAFARFRMFVAAATAIMGGSLATAGDAAVQGPSTLQPPYLLPSDPSSGVRVISIISNGNGVAAPDETHPRLNGAAVYRLVGAPDGLGALRSDNDLADGTFTLLCNHELSDNVGLIRDHGNRGAFVSRWTIHADPANLAVIGGQDLIQGVFLYNTTSGNFNFYDAAAPMPRYFNNVLSPPPAFAPFWGMARFCSADLAAPAAYRFGELGTDDRIFLNGEEIGSPGRSFAHVAGGAEAGTTYELPWLGDCSRENAVACPFPQVKTIVISLDDSSPGQVYVYVGEKSNAGTTTDRAGLNHGLVYGVVVPDPPLVSGVATESRTNVLGNGVRVESKPFSLFNLGSVQATTGAVLNSASNANLVLNFRRPEDGAWDLNDASVFYFATTDDDPGNSRLWKLDFDDITQPALGGVLTMLGDGSSAATFAGGITSASGATDVRMLDNLCAVASGCLLIQEDVGEDSRRARVWRYDLAADSMTEVAIADPARFVSGGANFLTIDEESSGIIDASGVLGPGWFLLTLMAHYSSTFELVEGGQIMAMFVPQTLPLILGDANCDGVVNILDINPFILALGDPLAYAAEYPFCDVARCDMNGDGLADILDINPFVTAILNR